MKRILLIILGALCSVLPIAANDRTVESNIHYHLEHLPEGKIAYDFKLYGHIKLQLNAGVQNILNAWQKDFDKGPERDSGYIYGPSSPRCFFAGVKIGW